MPRVSTFCPRCGETIETEVPEEARAQGRAELTCPACRFEFVIAPARRGGAVPPVPPRAPTSSPGFPGRPADQPPVRASDPMVIPGATRSRPQPTFKPVAAAMMLFFATLVAVYLGSILTFQDDIVEVTFEEMAGTGNFTGTVYAPGGDPLANVTVTLFDGRIDEARDNATPYAATQTDDAGKYRFQDVPLGIYTARLVQAGHTTVWLEAPAYPPEYEPFFGDDNVFGTVEMESGSPSEERNVSVVQDMQKIVRGWGIFILIGGAVAAAGGVASLRRRGFPLAVIGAVGAFLSWGFFFGMLLGLVAGILIIMARREFRPLRKTDSGSDRPMERPPEL